MINVEEAFDKLLGAVKSIENDYIVVDYDENVPDNDLQTERSYVNVLYHRWSSLLDQNPDKPISSHELRLGSEIVKHFTAEKGILVPDMVLHGGQNDCENQLIACEIKRELKRSNENEVLKDFIKLYHYLNLKRYVIKGDNEDAKYLRAVFIALNSTEEYMVSYIRKLFENFSEIKVEEKYLNNSSKEEIKDKIKEDAGKIWCISVEPSGNPDDKPIVDCVCLSDIIN